MMFNVCSCIINNIVCSLQQRFAFLTIIKTLLNARLLLLQVAKTMVGFQPIVQDESSPPDVTDTARSQGLSTNEATSF